MSTPDEIFDEHNKKYFNSLEIQFKDCLGLFGEKIYKMLTPENHLEINSWSELMYAALRRYQKHGWDINNIILRHTLMNINYYVYYEQLAPINTFFGNTELLLVSIVIVYLIQNHTFNDNNIKNIIKKSMTIYRGKIDASQFIKHIYKDFINMYKKIAKSSTKEEFDENIKTMLNIILESGITGNWTESSSLVERVYLKNKDVIDKLINDPKENFKSIIEDFGRNILYIDYYKRHSQKEQITEYIENLIIDYDTEYRINKLKKDNKSFNIKKIRNIEKEKLDKSEGEHSIFRFKFQGIYENNFDIFSRLKFFDTEPGKEFFEEQYKKYKRLRKQLENAMAIIPGDLIFLEDSLTKQTSIKQKIILQSFTSTSSYEKLARDWINRITAGQILEIKNDLKNILFSYYIQIHSYFYLHFYYVYFLYFLNSKVQKVYKNTYNGK
jgi:hypothetical protein